MCSSGSNLPQYPCTITVFAVPYSKKKNRPMIKIDNSVAYKLVTIKEKHNNVQKQKTGSRKLKRKSSYLFTNQQNSLALFGNGSDEVVRPDIVHVGDQDSGVLGDRVRGVDILGHQS